MCPSSALPSGHQSYMPWGCPLCGLCGPFCCGGLTTMSGLVGMAGPVWLIIRLCLVQRLLATGDLGWVSRGMAAEPQEIPGLVLAHGWAEPSQCGLLQGQLSQIKHQPASAWGQFLTWLTVASDITKLVSAHC